MKLENKKSLVARTLGVGKDRIVFNSERLAEIKEAITKQDIKDLLADKAISIKLVNGRSKNIKRKTRRRPGSIKKKVKNGKTAYVILTRKLRKHLANLKSRDNISLEDYRNLRKQVRASEFKSLSNMKERIVEYANLDSSKTASKGKKHKKSSTKKKKSKGAKKWDL